MIKHCSTKRNSGFTLVELLVVIAIISILAGALTMMINPATQQRKAKEVVLKAKTGQLCLALNACGAAKDSALLCDSYADLGVTDPTGEPVNATYSVSSATSSTDTVTISGAFPTGATSCTYMCSFNFDTGDIVKLTQGGSCL